MSDKSKEDQLLSNKKFEGTTLEDLRARQTKFAKRLHTTPEVTEADRAYYEKLRKSENFEKDYSFTGLMANVLLKPKAQSKIVPYPISTADCLELFYALLQRELSVNDDVLVVEEVNKRKIAEMVSFFTGHETKNLNPRKGIYLYGATGRGKTMIMKSLLALCAMIENKLKAAEQQFTSRRFTMSNAKSIVTELAQLKKPEVLKKYYSGVLCIDDLGMEDTYKLWGNDMNVVGDIIVERYIQYQQTGQLTHATSNIVCEDWKAKYGDRVDGRMNEMFNVIRLEGIDKRKK